MPRVVLLLACLLLITGCAGDAGENTGDTQRGTAPSGSGEQTRTLTEQEAAARAEKHVQSAVAALPAEPNLTLQYADSAECLDPTDNGPRGRYQVGRTYWLDGLPSGRDAEFVNILHKYWMDNGYRVLTDKRSASDKFVSVESKEDAFRMSVKQSVEGDLSIGASSPCVWPDGVPPTSNGG